MRIESIEDLPDEILLEICSYLSCEDLVSLKFISDRMEQISLDSALWKKLAYRPREIDSNEKIMHILSEAPKLQKILFNSGEVTPDVINVLVSNCRQVKYLEFDETQELSYILIEKLHLHCRHIEHLTIPESVLYDAMKSEAVGQFEKLISLAINFPDFCGVTAAHLKGLTVGCPNLEHLDFTYVYYTINDLDIMLSMKKYKLKSLCIRCCSIDHVCCIPLLSTCTALRALLLNVVCEADTLADLTLLKKVKSLKCITFHQLIDADIDKVIDLFDNEGIPQLLELNILHYDNYDDELAKVIMKNCPSLISLGLKSCCDLTDESLKYINRLKHLELIDLEGSVITDQGIKYLSACSSLRYLGLARCRGLTGSGLQPLMNLSELKHVNLDDCDISEFPVELIPSKLSKLTLLSIDNCTNATEVAQKLKVAMPRLSVVYECNRYNVK